MFPYTILGGMGCIIEKRNKYEKYNNYWTI